MTATPLRLFVPRAAAVRLSLIALPIVLLSDNSRLQHSLLLKIRKYISQIFLRVTPSRQTRNLD